MARRYKRNSKGQFASTGFGGSTRTRRTYGRTAKNGTRRAYGTRAVPNRGGIQFDFATGGITLQVGKGDWKALAVKGATAAVKTATKVATAPSSSAKSTALAISRKSGQ